MSPVSTGMEAHAPRGQSTTSYHSHVNTMVSGMEERRRAKPSGGELQLFVWLEADPSSVQGFLTRMLS